ncbi:MAG: hypothetical protein ACXWNK_10900 [Vulcanimicrobiaceae bacterium]
MPVRLRAFSIRFGKSVVAARYNDLVSSLNYSHIPTTLGLDRLQSLLTLHGLPSSAAVSMLGQTYMLNATVQAYGDTFLLGAIVVAICVPIAFLLGGRKQPKAVR